MVYQTEMKVRTSWVAVSGLNWIQLFISTQERQKITQAVHTRSWESIVLLAAGWLPNKTLCVSWSSWPVRLLHPARALRLLIIPNGICE